MQYPERCRGRRGVVHSFDGALSSGLGAQVYTPLSGLGAQVHTHPCPVLAFRYTHPVRSGRSGAHPVPGLGARGAHRSRPVLSAQKVATACAQLRPPLRSSGAPPFRPRLVRALSAPRSRPVWALHGTPIQPSLPRSVLSSASASAFRYLVPSPTAFSSLSFLVSSLSRPLSPALVNSRPPPTLSSAAHSGPLWSTAHPLAHSSPLSSTAHSLARAGPLSSTVDRPLSRPAERPSLVLSLFTCVLRLRFDRTVVTCVLPPRV